MTRGVRKGISTLVGIAIPLAMLALALLTTADPDDLNAEDSWFDRNLWALLGVASLTALACLVVRPLRRFGAALLISAVLVAFFLMMWAIALLGGGCCP